MHAAPDEPRQRQRARLGVAVYLAVTLAYCAFATGYDVLQPEVLAGITLVLLLALWLIWAVLLFLGVRALKEGRRLGAAGSAVGVAGLVCAVLLFF